MYLCSGFGENGKFNGNTATYRERLEAVRAADGVFVAGREQTAAGGASLCGFASWQAVTTVVGVARCADMQSYDGQDVPFGGRIGTPAHGESDP